MVRRLRIDRTVKLVFASHIQVMFMPVWESASYRFLAKLEVFATSENLGGQPCLFA
jgi:hypothetical protein